MISRNSLTNSSLNFERLKAKRPIDLRVENSEGSGQMQFLEYKETWAFLAQPGGEAEMKRAFDSVDVDGSGNVDWNEFCFSIMGAAASTVTYQDF